MTSIRRPWLFIAGLIMNGLGFWASTFAGSFLDDTPQITIGLYLFGLALIMTYVFISSIAFDKLEKRITKLEGKPEDSKK